MLKLETFVEIRIIGHEVVGIWPSFGDTDSKRSPTHKQKGDLINSAHVNPRSVNRIATGDDSGYVKLFTFPCNESQQRGEEAEQSHFTGHSAHVTSVMFTHNDSHLISAGGEDSWLVLSSTSIVLNLLHS